MIHTRAQDVRTRRRAAFTIIELLLVVAIIAILASIVLVSAGGVLGGARRAAAQRQLQSILQGIQTFEGDFDRLPPLLTRKDPSDTTVTVPEAEPGSALNVSIRLRRARYSSIYTLGVYLLGAGDIDGSELGNKTGQNTDLDDGNAGPGFRDPGIDFSWGGADDRQAQRNNETAIRTGRVFGPYLDLASMEDSLVLDKETGLLVVLDPWSQPIRYYKDWPTIDRQTRSASIDRIPIELRSRLAVERHMELGQPQLDLDRQVLNTRVALLSAGEPFIVDSAGDPIANFGEYGTDPSRSPPLTATPIQGPTALETGNFDPSTLAKGDQRYLLDRLGSNLKATY